MKRLYIPFGKKRNTSKAFTLVELLVVIALISLMATWTIMSSSDNSQTVATDARDRILNDIVMFKKLSLLEKNDNGLMYFHDNMGVFWLTYPTHNNYLFTLESANLNTNNTWNYIARTIYSGANVNGENSNVTMDLDYRDTSNTIRTIIPSFPFQLQTNNNIDLPFSLPQKTPDLPLDQYFNIYVQNPNQLEDKSNEVAFVFLAPRNYNDTPDDDILMKLYDENDTTELSAAKAIFDAYGRMHWEAIKKIDNSKYNPSKIYIRLFKRSTLLSDPTKPPLTSFPLPADY
jgi:prepilin-type N-terminal cleavage/methylation domain-containing protein